MKRYILLIIVLSISLLFPSNKDSTTVEIQYEKNEIEYPEYFNTYISAKFCLDEITLLFFLYSYFVFHCMLQNNNHN